MLTHWQKSPKVRRCSLRSEHNSDGGSKAIAHVVVVKNLSHAPQVVQMQALEVGSLLSLPNSFWAEQRPACQNQTHIHSFRNLHCSQSLPAVTINNSIIPTANKTSCTTYHKMKPVLLTGFRTISCSFLTTINPSLKTTRFPSTKVICLKM